MKWIRFARVALLFGVVLGTAVTFAQADPITVEDGTIKVRNTGYVVDFSAANGSITAVRDVATTQTVSGGNAGGSLWSATFDNDKLFDTTSADFSYEIDGSKLTLSYGGASVAVTVEVDATDGNALKMQATVSNYSERKIRLVGFPNDLRVAEADVEDALLPLMPGALINGNFFSKGGTYNGQYPGELFADYEAVRLAKGKFALYSQIGDLIQPVYAGFEHLKAETGQTALTHNYKTWITDGATWTSPWTVIRVGEDYPDSIAAYRTENGIDQYPSLSAKLGADAEKYYSEPMYKLDIQVLRQKFIDIETNVIDQMNFPGLVEPVAWQVNGHDR
ncbi:MAG: hypothetical protein ABI700_12435, partial [Chloroflexota bacterium]